MSASDHLSGVQFNGEHPTRRMSEGDRMEAAKRTAEMILQRWSEHPEREPGYQRGGNRGRV